ncbi:conjugal transfer protein TraG N-terminal domain-containing protein [Geothermobacter hydrogeniphilus]|uniref:conjugal transfer protein TraG N-terminal domain-containing protein n=1 Tax=Geothermobacter hydrogeniphilus TaxID=1969733 RepID=UPI0015540EEA|nr:conjugal transfer protein TraG N-terminal domain-containing protein [Geothermobacter hydrogeniphilus]
MKKLFLFLSFLFLPAQALAIDGEFYTYGGFDAVVAGFQRIALIFSDNAYQTLFYSVIVLGILLGSVNLVMRVATGARLSPVGWLVPVFVGILLYLGMVVPTGTMHIYSQLTNRYTPVAGVPDGVIAVAHVLNSIERGLIEIIETSSDPKSYPNQAGGTGYMGLLEMVSTEFSIPDTYLNQNLDDYIDKCVAYEVDTPGSTLTVEELRRGTTDFRTALGKANNPALTTVVYSAANPQGSVATCADAWSTTILPGLNNATTFDAAIDEICAKTGYDPATPASRQKCQTAIQDVLDDLGVISTTTDFARQALLAKRLHEVFRSGNTAALTNYKFMVNAKGTMVAMNEWLPIMKGVLTAIALSMVPILALFLPTPLIGKALSVFLGMMIWLVTWGVIDAMLHSFAMDLAGRFLLEIRNLATTPGAMGMDPFLFAPDELTKVLGMFGMIRSSGLMLSTVMTAVLVKFGGHALASMAGNLMGQVQGVGLQAARLTEDPSGRAAALNANLAAMPTQTIANAPRGYEMMMHGSMVNQMSNVASGQAHAAKVAYQQQAGGVGGGSAWGATGAGMELLTRSMKTGKVVGDDGKATNYSVGDGVGMEGSQTTLASGWTQKSSVRREDGDVAGGTVTQVSASGTITETANAQGETTTHIQAAGFSNSFGLAYQEVGIEKGAHTLSTGENWNHMMQEVDKDSIISGEARAFKTALSDRVTSSVRQQMSDGSAYQSVSSETKEKLLQAGTQVGLSGGKLLQALTLGMVTIQGSIGGSARLTTKDGETATISMSQEEVKALNHEIATMREEALTQTMQTSAGRDYAASTSAADNASEGFSYLREVATRNTTSTAFTTDLMTGYVDDRAKEMMADEPGRYQDLNAARRAVLDDMNRQRLGTGVEQDALNRDINAWTMRHYDDYLDTSTTGNSVMRDIAHTRNRVDAGVREHRAAGEAAAGRAKEAVADNTFEDPRPGKIGPPDVPGVVGARETRKQAVQDVKNEIPGVEKKHEQKNGWKEDDDVAP